MSQIVVENLKKTFKVAKRQAGVLNAVKSLMHREYTTVSAIEGISFKLDEGELVGYIGPNGAGKSTTVKVMSGILVPDSGKCEIMGLVPWKHRIAHVKKIGVVFGQRTQLWWDVPVIDTFELLKDIYRIPDKSYTKIKDELVERLNLQALLDTPVRQLSLGQRMRCELAASLLHEPPILFLDEPTIGLDAVSKLAVRDFIKSLNRDKGVTVILTTHDMDDIEALCKRIMVIGKGRILFDGTVHQLRNTVIPERIAKIDFGARPEHLVFSYADVVRVEENHAELRFNPEETSAAKLIRAISEENEIKDFMIENPPIEEIIAKIYGGFDI